MSPDVSFALHVVDLAITTALVYGYNYQDHPPFWKLTLICLPVALVIHVTALAFFGLVT